MPTSNEIEHLLTHYLENYAQGTYVYHWLSHSDELSVMTYCGQARFQLAGIPIPIGHWGHQLLMGPPCEYLELLTSSRAQDTLKLNARQYDELLERVNQALEADPPAK